MNSPSELDRKRSVYVVEPHPVAACHLATALKRIPALEVIPSGVNLPNDAVLSKKSSLLIVDADALPFPLVPYLHTVKLLFPDAQILVIGKRLPDDELCRILFHGVRGFVVYDQVDKQLCPAVDALFRGRTWVRPEVLDRYPILSSTLSRCERYVQGALSPRESEIVGLLQRRLCDKEISSALGVSEHTVRFHLQNIFDKLGVHDRYSVIERTRRPGLAGMEGAGKTAQRAPGRRGGAQLSPKAA